MGLQTVLQLDKYTAFRYDHAKRTVMATLESKLKKLEKDLGYKFKSKNRLIHALTHSSYKNEFIHGSDKGTKLDRTDNERLEFFGDAVLAFVMSKKLFQLFPEKHEGELSKFRSLLVSRKALIAVAKKIKLHHYIRLGKSETKLKLQDKSKILADAFEAIIAAVYQDSGMKAAEDLIDKHFSAYLNQTRLKRLNSSENYKSILQEHTQKDHHLLPRYKTVMKKDRFDCTIYFRNKSIGSASGKSKREAEKIAAKKALAYYRNNLQK